MSRVSKYLAGILLLFLVAIPSIYFAQSFTRLAEPEKGEFPLKDFSGVRSANFFRVYVEQASAYSVRVESRIPGLFADLRVFVDDGDLVIDLSDEAKRARRIRNVRSDDVVFYVQSPSIERLILSGSGDILVTNSLKTPSLTLKLTGSGDIRIEGAEVDGAIVSKLSGSGDIRMRDIKALEGDLSLVGSGAIKTGVLTFKDRIVLAISGSGDISTGDISATSSSISVTGSGEVNAGELRTTGDTRIRATGSGDIRLQGVSGAPLVEVEGTGSCDIAIGTLKAGRGDFSLSGSGELRVRGEGAVERCSVRLSSSGAVSLERVQCEEAEVTVLGSGEVKLHVNKELKVNRISGSGEISYRGNPKVIIHDKRRGGVRRLD